MVTFLRLLVIISGACLFGWRQTHASCLPGLPPPTFYVGSDSKCNYTTIQAAITDVSTIATCAPTIVISSEHSWTEHLTITDRSLTLIGTTSNCGTSGTTGFSGTSEVATATPTSPQLTINGAGDTTTSVITINGNSNVTLKYIEITGGNPSFIGSRGGGILFNGTGSLTLDTTTVDANQAGLGGGIAMSPTGNATLALLTNALITNNTAVFGGGIVTSGAGTTTLTVGPNASVSNNIADNSGGGIFFGTAGSLTITDATVSKNQSYIGGGIQMSPISGKNATLTLGHGSVIEQNAATDSGGGILIEGDTHLIAVDGQTSVSYNDARNGNGGGIKVIAPARADIGSGGYEENGTIRGVITSNSAYNGGGISATSNAGEQDAYVQLFSTDAYHPVTLQGNRAEVNGGAIYLKPFDGGIGDTGTTRVCAHDFLIQGSTGIEGAAIYLDWAVVPGIPRYGGDAVLNSTSIYLWCGQDKPADFSAVACAAGISCNEIFGNIAENFLGAPTNAAAIFVGHGAHLFGDNIRRQAPACARRFHRRPAWRHLHFPQQRRRRVSDTSARGRDRPECVASPARHSRRIGLVRQR